MSFQIKKIWLISLALGWLWDFLFWKHIPGISFAIYVILCILAGFSLIVFNRQKISRNSIGLLITIFIFSMFTFIRQEPLSLLLSIGCTLLLMQIMAMTFINGKWLSFGLADYGLGFLRLWKSVIIHPATPNSLVSEIGHEIDKKSASHQIRQVVRGIILAIPILIIYSILLSSADLVFAQKMSSIFELFSLDKIPEYLLRMIMICFVAYVLMGVYQHAIEKSRLTTLINENNPAFKAFLGFTESTIVIGSVVCLFTAFVVIQFQYFFGGQTNIHIDGYTYSEYARRGFGELLIVAVFSLLLLLGLTYIVKRDNTKQRRIFSGLASIMVALVGIMLISAFQRLLLYESAYGFTRLRIYTHVFMIWLGILMILTILLEIYNRFRFFTNTALLVTLGFALSINFLNVDSLIVQRNVQRSTYGEEIDTAYLASLSTDAVPKLVSLFQSPAFSIDTRDALGASLACMIQIKPSIQIPVEDWRSFQLSHWKAEHAISLVSGRLKEYKAKYNDAGWQITSPKNRIFFCQSTWRID